MTKYVTTTVALIAILSLMLSGTLYAAPSNMLPRFPEFIIEKGLSENFKVTTCEAKVKIVGSDAESSLKVAIKNRGNSAVQSSVKFRVLYPTSENQVQVSVNGRRIGYDRDKPRHTFELKPDETIVFDLKAKIAVNYSIDSIRKALKEQEKEPENKRKGFLADDFTRLFEREKFGKRFMVGPLVSKWGVFPVDFESVKLEVTVPDDFVVVTQKAEAWQETRTGRSKTYQSSSIDDFSAAVFLPETDREEFIQSQKILTSERFMH